VIYTTRISTAAVVSRISAKRMNQNRLTESVGVYYLYVDTFDTCSHETVLNRQCYNSIGIDDGLSQGEVHVLIFW